MNIKYTTTSSSTAPVDYFTEPVTTEAVNKNSPALPYTQPTSYVLSTSTVSSESQVNEQLYQQRAHSLVIKRYAIKRT